MRKTRWKDLVITGIMIVSLSACGTAAQETPPAQATRTPVPATSTTIPSTSTPTPSNTAIPPTRTPFPASCEPADATILETIKAFEVFANDKNLEGTTALFSETAIVEESFRRVYLDTPRDIEVFWQNYYKWSVPSEFRDISVCGNIATFIWVDLYALPVLWPVVTEIHDGMITYWDFYEQSIIETNGGE